MIDMPQAPTPALLRVSAWAQRLLWLVVLVYFQNLSIDLVGFDPHPQFYLYFYFDFFDDRCAVKSAQGPNLQIRFQRV